MERATLERNLVRQKERPPVHKGHSNFRLAYPSVANRPYPLCGRIPSETRQVGDIKIKRECEVQGAERLRG